MRPKKSKAVRIRPRPGDLERAERIAEATGLGVTDIMCFAMSAALKALKEDNCRMELPLEMRVKATNAVAIK